MSKYELVVFNYPIKNLDKLNTPIEDIFRLRTRQKESLTNYTLNTVGDYLTWIMEGGQAVVNKLPGFNGRSMMELYFSVLRHLNLPIDPIHGLKYGREPKDSLPEVKVDLPPQVELRKDLYGKVLNQLVTQLENTLTPTMIKSVQSYVYQIGFGAYLNEFGCLILCDPKGFVYVNLGTVLPPVIVGKLLGHYPEIGYTLTELVPAVEITSDVKQQL